MPRVSRDSRDSRDSRVTRALLPYNFTRDRSAAPREKRLLRRRDGASTPINALHLPILAASITLINKIELFFPTKGSTRDLAREPFQRAHSIFMKSTRDIVFEQIFRSCYFVSVNVHLERMKIPLKVGD